MFFPDFMASGNLASWGNMRLNNPVGSNSYKATKSGAGTAQFNTKI
jgi:hypothetical protein